MTKAEQLYQQYKLTYDIDVAYYRIRKSTKERYTAYKGKYSTAKFRFDDNSFLYVKCTDGFPYQIIKV